MITRKNTIKYKRKYGFTLIETLISITIIIVLAALIIPSFSRFRNEQTLRNTAEDIASLLNNARNNTLSSLNSTNYGVHIESHRAVLFVGSTFTEPLSTNVQIDFDSLAIVPSSGGINLNGGGSNVVFNRLSGDTSNYGTIVVQMSSNSARQITITITKTGIISTN